jgi:hypothetical protein
MEDEDPPHVFPRDARKGGEADRARRLDCVADPFKVKVGDPPLEFSTKFLGRKWLGPNGVRGQLEREILHLKFCQDLVHCLEATVLRYGWLVLSNTDGLHVEDGVAARHAEVWMLRNSSQLWMDLDVVAGPQIGLVQVEFPEGRIRLPVVGAEGTSKVVLGTFR